MPISLLHTITFLAAFLLFQIELIIAKMLLPVYGGSYFVWGACLVFFQAFLLLGYVFVHFAIRRFTISGYRKIQLLLVFLVFLFFPGQPLKIDGAESSWFLAGSVFWRLLLSIGPVFFVLSTMSVALQSWLAGSSLEQRTNPYALYATSNAGSLLALLSYPFLFEYFFTLQQQEFFWRTAYALLAGLNVFLFVLVPVAPAPLTPQDPVPGKKFLHPHAILWLLFSAASVMLFMAVTNVITYALAPVPLLWILPLAIYLGAFILSFKPKPWCPDWVVRGLPLLLAVGALLFLTINIKSFPVMIQFMAVTLALFFLCLYCQNRLAVYKPESARDLTAYYLMISTGGFLGGFITSWIMPLISQSVIEYPLALTLIAVAVWIGREEKQAFSRLPKILSRGIQVGLISFAPLILGWFWVPELLGMDSGALCRWRNYYGIYDVSEVKYFRLLIHGTTIHGVQLRHPGMEREPSAYYSTTSPIGKLLLSDDFSFQSLGAIGLGAGTLAIYTKPEQTMDIYELDPDVETLARRYFPFLKGARGKINIIYGDARRSLDQAPDKRYDILIVDAFGGDYIPVHLVTREAIAKYKTHLKDGGLLLFHISNHFIRLESVLVSVAEDANAKILFGASSGLPSGLPSYWSLITWDEEKYQTLLIKHKWEPTTARLIRRHRIWTDGYSNILPFLDWDEIKKSLLSFKLLPSPFKR